MKNFRVSIIASSLLLATTNLMAGGAGDEHLTYKYGSSWSVNNNGNYIITNVVDISTIQVEDIESNITKPNDANLTVYSSSGTLKSAGNLASGDYLDVNNSGNGKRYLIFGIKPQIALGERHTLLLSEDGRVYSFGDGDSGRLGHGDTNAQTSPKQIEVAGENNITQISVGAHHSILLDKYGKVYSFGVGGAGRLGHGDTNNQTYPKQIEVAGENNITQISAGGYHTILLDKNGKVYSFGDGGSGRLGHGNTTDVTLPTQIVNAGESNITQISAGGTHSILLDKNSSVYSFGDGGSGQLGHGNKNNQTSPKRIAVAGENNITQISAGGAYSILLDKNSKVYSFGDGGGGRLGHGNTNDQTSPKQIVVAEENNITQISAGGYHIILLNKNGKVYSFGVGSAGRLGHGDTNNQTSPKQIEVAGENNITQISTGGYHSMLLDKNGSVYSFGDGGYGRLGHNDTNNQTSPKEINEIKLLANINTNTKVNLTSVIMANKWNMISVPNERNVSVSVIPNSPIIWTYNNSSNAWEQPTILQAGKGYIFYTTSTSNYDNIDGIATTSIVINDYTTIKNVASNTWTLVGISRSTSGIAWNDIYKYTNTLKTDCSYTQIFYFDANNSTWNTSSKIPYQAGIWAKQNCFAQPLG